MGRFVRRSRCGRLLWQGLGTLRFHFHELLGRDVGLLRDQDSARFGQLFQAIRKVHIGTRGIIGLVHAVFDRLHNNFTRVNANPDLQIRIAERVIPSCIANAARQPRTA